MSRIYEASQAYTVIYGDCPSDSSRDHRPIYAGRLFYMENFQVYHDIQARTGGDIYIGVVGPVRTGKSTFIRRFMELVALPAMSQEKKAELQDELPLSGAGKMITTVEPKFIPKKYLGQTHR